MAFWILDKQILHVACHNLSQHDVTLVLRTILAFGLELTRDLEH